MHMQCLPYQTSQLVFCNRWANWIADSDLNMHSSHLRKKYMCNNLKSTPIHIQIIYISIPFNSHLCCWALQIRLKWTFKSHWWADSEKHISRISSLHFPTWLQLQICVSLRSYSAQEWCKHPCINYDASKFLHAAMKYSVHCRILRKANVWPLLLSDEPTFLNQWALYTLVWHELLFRQSCAGGVLTTDRRRPSHRWGDSETHPPSAPYWPALSTSRWAAHVWMRTAPSKGKEGGVTAQTKSTQLEEECEEERGLHPCWRLTDSIWKSWEGKQKTTRRNNAHKHVMAKYVWREWWREKNQPVCLFPASCSFCYLIKKYKLSMSSLL